MPQAKTQVPTIRDKDYRTLALVRAELRAFAHFTELNTASAGLTPQQHQILLALRASGRLRLTIGQLAEAMLVKPHSVSGMADRLEHLGLVERVQDASDRRRVNLRLTDKARDLLASLGHVHKAELRRIRPLLISLLSELD